MRATAKRQSPVTEHDRSGLELGLQCPQCGVPVGTLRQDEFPPEFLYSCATCHFQMLNEDGIWKALPAVRKAHFERFLREYQAVREAEGRGSRDPEYYLALTLSGPVWAQPAAMGDSVAHVYASWNNEFCPKSKPKRRAI